MHYRRFSILGIIALITITTALIWWRWIYLPPTKLDLIHVKTKKTPAAAPLDVILQKNSAALEGSPALLAQFRRPPQQAHIKPLWVDRCEVNQGLFRRFAHWNAAQEIRPPSHPEQPPDWQYQSLTEKHKILGQLEVPAGGLSFFDAWAYCHATGGRLPTSEEFEAIASGKEKRLYPWGNHFNNSAWSYQDPALNIAARCGNYPQTDTPDKIHDLGNSLLEWTTHENEPVLMGGNAFQRPATLHALNLIRRPAPPDYRSQYSGFRCVYNRSTDAPRSHIRLPWGGESAVAPVAEGHYPIGPDTDARIPALLQHLGDGFVTALNHFPIKPVHLHLRVMRYEVTVAMYRRFLRDPLVAAGMYDHRRQPPTIRHRPDDWEEQVAQANDPITNVSWWSAWAFAHWIGGRLPSAEEWQALAGADLTRFPYGNDYQPTRTVNRDRIDAHWHALDVMASNDAGQNTILGFSGNVAEWTNTSLLRGRAFTIVIKGGSFYMPEAGGQIDQSGEAPPHYHSADLGFRVVFPLPKS